MPETTTRRFILEVNVTDETPTPYEAADAVLDAFHAAYGLDVLPEWIDTINDCSPDPDWLYAGKRL